MSNDEIKELIQLVVESGIAELEVQRGEDRVRIRRTIESAATASAPWTVIETAQSAPAPAPAPAANEYIQKSPIVGTFYDAPSPDAEPFVKVGDRIEVGKVLCIVEAMKLMNEIESDVAGEVVRRIAASGQPVEYGQALFAIKAR